MGIKSKIASILAVSALATSVFAGGPEPAPVCGPFDGAYIGVAGGWAWLESRARYKFFTATNLLVSSFSSNNTDSDFAVGGVVGFGKVFQGNYYAGLEVHGTYHDIDVTRNSPVFGLTVRTRARNEWDWGVDFMPGYVVTPKMLVFGKIGYRGGEFKLGGTTSAPAPVGVLFTAPNISRYASGFNLGAGVKYNVWRSLSAWVEYDYTWYDSARRVYPAFIAATAVQNYTPNYQQVLVGLSYNFCGRFGL